MTGEEISPGNGAFAFAYPYPSGGGYDVRILTQPNAPSQVCTVERGAGTIATADVTDVAVVCTTPEPNGALDPSFGGSGTVTGAWTTGARAIAVQGDGRILVLGAQALARYEADGTLDLGFGSGGVAPVSFTGGISVEAQDVAVQPDGRILVAGYMSALAGSQSDFALARYEADGSLDPSFGSGGALVTDWNGRTDRAYAVLIQGDGKIVLAGHAGTPAPGGSFGNDFALARYEADGTLDASFGSGGKATVDIAGLTDLGYAAALLDDGRIVVAGRVASTGGADPDVGLARFSADGALDTAFGQQGVVRIDLSGGSWDEVSDVAVASDGAILASIQARLGSSFDFMLARFLADGALDPAFGSVGVATVAFGTGDDFARDLAVQADGRILVAGLASTAGASDFGVARWLADGTPDSTFGDGGKLTLDFFGAADSAQGVALQADGKVLLAGSVRNGSSNQLGMARLVP